MFYIKKNIQLKFFLRFLFVIQFQAIIIKGQSINFLIEISMTSFEDNFDLPVSEV